MYNYTIKSSTLESRVELLSLDTIAVHFTTSTIGYYQYCIVYTTVLTTVHFIWWWTKSDYRLNVSVSKPDHSPVTKSSVQVTCSSSSTVSV